VRAASVTSAGLLTQLTTTSYLILGLLSSRDWSAYELAEQIGKGVTEIWPRASRQLYNAPKQLVEQGLVSAVKQRTGRRQRTVYSITDSGRAELRRWLSTEAKPPSLEFEAMVHVVLADQGSLEDLQNTLERVVQQANEARELFESHREFIDATEGGTFPERQHLFVLSSAFMIGHFTHMAAWATWALGEVRTWRDATGPA
jgi:PadR family transcriptional regulator, regulatory protein AphA